MKEKYVLDTFAWVEYFRGSKSGKVVDEILKNNECFTPTIVIAELQTKFLKENLNFLLAFNLIKRRTKIISLDEEIAMLAGKLNFERKMINPHWSLYDSIVLATAKKINAKIITGDRDFIDLRDEVLFLKE